MVQPSAGMGAGLFFGKVAALQDFCLDDVVRIRRLAARVQNAEHVIAAIPVGHDDTHQHDSVADRSRMR